MHFKSTDTAPEEFRENIAHITLSDGTIFQVLNEAGDDWDEAATSAEIDEYLAKTPAAKRK